MVPFADAPALMPARRSELAADVGHALGQFVNDTERVAIGLAESTGKCEPAGSSRAGAPDLYTDLKGV